MPRRRFVKRDSRPVRRRRRRARRNFRRASRVATLRPFRHVFTPNYLWRRLRYCGSARIVNTLSNMIDPSVGSAWVFRANSLFDPDQSGAGGQPLGFDQHMLFYYHYWCPKSVIRIRLENTDNMQGKTVTLRLNRQAAINHNLCTEIEHGCKKVMVGNYGSGDANKTISLSYNQGRFYGKRNRDNIFRGSDASNPTEEAFYIVGVVDTDTASTTTGPVQLYVEIDYYVQFYERRSIIPS